MNKLNLSFNKKKKFELSKEELELIENWLGNKYTGDMTIPAIVDFSLETDIEYEKIVVYLAEKVLESRNEKH
ncbi:hypothetical protein ACWJXF_12760 [Clostridioides difficile]|uniref:hypothetical protein n=1 Tax=Clostridioides difficile TaxID=1496 RepID=UPI000D46363B|nr:hypothetical protein [Clostridioides difficile]MBF9991459.1 hypothetical protein [Clostridioides difficile]MBZ1092956.1 hypothetical protein [Clostridioides difficile]MBZ4462717.1 hypothetical protein [Clostridioides difficile]MCI9972581.1 hypothetical protein [Clostridioides difficile]MCJ0114939.1 hypothetical protein [Clostridioides difficile]